MSIRKYIRAIVSMSIMLLPLAGSAQGFIGGVQQGAQAVAKPAGFSDASLAVIIGNIIGIALSLVGVILVVILIYAGFLWMTASGNSEQVKKARGMIINAIIGLVILVSAFAIVNFVIGGLTATTTGVTGTGGQITP